MSEGQSTRSSMLQKPVFGLVAKTAFPTTVIQIITVIYNTADTYFVANLGKSAAAAVGVGFSLMSVIQAIGLGFGMGAGSLISRELGAKEEGRANRHASSALFAAILFSLLLCLFGSLNTKGLMKLLGASDSMLPYACDYARYILLACPAMCAALVLNIVLRSEGHAKYAMFGITAGGILNVLLDPLFIYRCGMGISGAAMATGISQSVGCAVLLIPFLSGKSTVKLSVRHISRIPSDYLQILTTGAPTVCRQGLAAIASAMLNRKARIFGDATIAAVTIANKIYLLVRNIVVGIGQGFQPVAGYNFGAGNRERVRKAFSSACVLGTAVCVVSSVAVFFGAKQIMAWFQSDSEVVSIGAACLYFACAAIPFMAYSTYVDQLFQCLGFRKTATFLACCRQGILFLPAILILPHLMGLRGIQMAQPLSDLLSFCLSMPFQILFFRRVLTGEKKENLVESSVG